MSLISRTFSKLFARNDTYRPSVTQRGPLVSIHMLVITLLFVLPPISVLIYLRWQSNRKTLNQMDEESVFVNLLCDTPPPNVLNKEPDIIQLLNLPPTKPEESVGKSTNFEVALVDNDGGLRRRQNTRSMRISERGGENYFACPFFKLDPLRHDRCLRFKLARPADIHSHLIRYHTLPEYFCPKCYIAFKESSDLNAHTKIDTCERGSNPEELWLQDIEELRHLIIRGQSDEEKWYRIWDAVFPAHSPPESPYFLSVVDESIGQLFSHDFWKRVLVRLRLYNLDLDGKASNILRECIMDKVFERTYSQKARYK